ncbi:hypothetical protein LEL_10894 [Akanthomyces lecanii RCEF 1005]|uniref:Uncharacterized protein n=1 Tax=Akanthomyces lecanii RCEF 1005 TaxID=1081108 RepID=A0A167R8D7_CORDF|nr:hypothetical protein LEL_10894 [Akanthomyces lecanii RCEF 1005]
MMEQKQIWLETTQMSSCDTARAAALHIPAPNERVFPTKGKAVNADHGNGWSDCHDAAKNTVDHAEEQIRDNAASTHAGQDNVPDTDDGQRQDQQSRSKDQLQKTCETYGLHSAALGRVEATDLTRQSPPCLTAPEQRYNLRERKSPTPNAFLSDQTTKVSREHEKTTVKSAPFCLALRPATGSVSIPDKRGEDAPPTLSATKTSSSTCRVQQHRARQRITRWQEHIDETNTPQSQVPIPSPAPIEPPVESTSATFPTAADPPDPGDEHTAEEANGADATLVRSVIVVSTGETFFGTTAENDEEERDHPSAADETKNVNETVSDCAGEHQDNHSEPECSARDESGLFVSDESWDLSVEGYVGDDSTLCVETLSSPDGPQHALPTEAGSASSVAPHPLDEIVAAIESAESTAGRTFLSRQSDAYLRIFQETLSGRCACQEPYQQSPDVDRDCFSIQEMTQWIRDRLEPALEQQHERTEGRQWQSLLAQPPASLSLSKSECDIRIHDVRITRAWDVDSIWLGPTSLAAIRPDNNSFRLSFNPPYTRSIAGNQIIAPHGVDLGHTRHTLLGSFVAGGIPMDVFVFFPNTNDGKPVKPQRARQQRAAKSPYTLLTQSSTTAVELDWKSAATAGRVGFPRPGVELDKLAGPPLAV